MVTGKELLSLVRRDATKRLRGVFLSGAKKAGFDQQRIMGALYLLFIDYDEKNRVPKELLDIIDQSAKYYDALVDTILDKISKEK